MENVAFVICSLKRGDVLREVASEKENILLKHLVIQGIRTQRDVILIYTCASFICLLRNKLVLLLIF